MYRPLFALVVLVLSASMASADEPVSVAAESAKINAAFSQAMRSAPRDRAAYDQAVAERNAALMKLAEAAEKAGSKEHLALAGVYRLLQRYDDAARQARAALTARETDFAAHLMLISASSAGGKTEDVLAAWQAFEKQADAHGASPEFLRAGASALSIVSQRLAASDKLPEAERLLADWKARLEKIDPLDDAVKDAVATAKRLAESLAGRLAAERKRLELIGKPYFPIIEATWLNGPPLKPEDLRGKVVLLDFWAVWCGPCIATFPHLRQWHDKYGDKGLVIVGVTQRYRYGWDADAKQIKHVDDLSPDDEDQATAAFVKHHELKHRIAVVPDRSPFTNYAVTGIPQVVVIDRQGLIRQIKVGSGEANAKALEATIRRALDLREETAAK